MRNTLLAAVIASAGLFSAGGASAAVSYNTTGSTLACHTASGCVQNTSTSITIGGITLTYNAGSGSGVLPPSFISLGNIVSTGAGSGDFTGAELDININSTPPGASGLLPPGGVSGFFSTIGTNQSLLAFQFSGTPQVVLTALDGTTYTYQLSTTQIFVQAPTVGNPVGQTTIGGSVSVPEPSTLFLLGSALFGAFGIARRRSDAAA